MTISSNTFISHHLFHNSNKRGRKTQYNSSSKSLFLISSSCSKIGFHLENASILFLSNVREW